MAIYDSIGVGYADHRRPDPRIASAIEAALGDARSVVNVGAGAGSYEPKGPDVLGVEPSAIMIAQRPADAAPCIQGVAEALPLETGSYDAAMAILTIHHWTDVAAGLRELRRVARKRVVLMTWVPDAPEFWLTRDYFPQVFEADLNAFPPTRDLESLVRANVGPPQLSPVLIPHDCTDGFLAAYWRRPARYLDPEARKAISSFSRFDAGPGLAKLTADLESGRWAARNAELADLDEADFGYRLVCRDLEA